MRSLKAVGLALSVALIVAASGCSDKAGVEEKTKITGPEGTTTITKDSKVETTGSNPPGATSTGTTKAPNP